MDTRERKNDEKKPAGTWPNMSCCGTDTRPGSMADCCGGIFESADRSSMMRRCMTMCRWFSLVPVILGIAFLLLGYCLDAEITRILWMVAAGFLILMGTFCLLMMSKMIGICHGTK